MVSASIPGLSDELAPSALARLRVERLLAHFRRFLAPDDEKILTLEERLAVLSERRSRTDTLAHP